MTVSLTGTPHLRAVPPPVDKTAHLRENQVIILNAAIQLLDNLLETSSDARLCLYLDESIQNAERAKARLS